VKLIFLAFYLSFILLFIFNLKNIGKARAIVLICTVLIFGIAFGATPNPMESLVKVFKLFNKMEGEGKILISIFFIFTTFSLIGSKFICSWGCPIGALQECLFNVMGCRSKHSIRIPFWLYSMLRMFIFGVFLVLLFGFGDAVVYGIKDFVVYHHVNYFKIFNFHELAKIALYTLPVFIILSLFIFRPFCHCVCPFGLYSWLLENISINRIHIDTEKCIRCGKCVNVCPTSAMKDIYNKKVYFLAECWSCGKCKDICPVGAITYAR
jgi:NAD-dependent dihydropyrimidine dehydrogenase PreA subunit